LGDVHPQPDPTGPGQESVWDYPRPPRCELTTEEIEIRLGGEVIAHTRSSYRVLETSHPPSYYLPVTAFADGVLRAVEGTTFCEWKGHASYYDLVTPAHTAPRSAWTYPSPTAGFEVIRAHLSVMPGLVDECLVDGEVVRAQGGGFYGGWVTSRVTGPFKGGPGTRGW
jgi:uncharacterized protein (DUF427 family)